MSKGCQQQHVEYMTLILKGSLLPRGTSGTSRPGAPLHNRWFICVDASWFESWIWRQRRKLARKKFCIFNHEVCFLRQGETVWWGCHGNKKQREPGQHDCGNCRWWRHHGPIRETKPPSINHPSFSLMDAFTKGSFSQLLPSSLPLWITCFWLQPEV